MSRLRGWLLDHLRTLLITLLSLLALVSWSLGRNLTNGELGNLLLNLTPEIIGAIIGVLVIDWFLKKHRQQSTRVPRALALERTYSLGKYTIKSLVNLIWNLQEGVVIKEGNLKQLEDAIEEHDFSSIDVNALDVFRLFGISRGKATYGGTPIRQIDDSLQGQGKDVGIEL